MTKPLSPAAQAVLDSMYEVNMDFNDENHAIAAAALLAAADQVVPEEPLHYGDQRWMFERDARQACRKKFLAIAAELKVLND
jgi:hypothetical protein